MSKDFKFNVGDEVLCTTGITGKILASYTGLSSLRWYVVSLGNNVAYHFAEAALTLIPIKPLDSNELEIEIDDLVRNPSTEAIGRVFKIEERFDPFCNCAGYKVWVTPVWMQQDEYYEIWYESNIWEIIEKGNRDG